MKTLKDTLQFCESDFPPALVAPSSLTAIKGICQHFSASITNNFGFENAVSAPSTAVDFALSVENPSAGWSLLSGASDLMDQRLFTHPAWQTIRTFCQRVSDPDHFLHRRVVALWLEFDTSHTPSDNEVTIPSLFIALPHEISPRDLQVQMVESILQALMPMPNAVYQQMRRCIDHLPSQAYVVQVGLMMSRHLPAIRLVLAFRAVSELINYVETLELSALTQEYRPVIAALVALADVTVLQLDIGAAIFPRIGIEFNFRYGKEHQNRLRPLLDHLLERGLCTPAKHEALTNYALTRRGDGWIPRIYVFGISHLKINLAPHQSPLAKAYFGVAQTIAILNRDQNLEISDDSVNRSK